MKAGDFITYSDTYLENCMLENPRKNPTKHYGVIHRMPTNYAPGVVDVRWIIQGLDNQLVLMSSLRHIHISNITLLKDEKITEIFPNLKILSGRVLIDGTYYRMRRGKLVSIPKEWANIVTSQKTIRNRKQEREIKHTIKGKKSNLSKCCKTTRRELIEIKEFKEELTNVE